jgi:uncharacterized membrane protein YccF (DUF307 family)
MLVRTVWYLFIGWWLSGLLISVAAVCILTVVGLPLALALINRLPGVLTLRPSTRRLVAGVNADGSRHYSLMEAQQRPMWKRALYFVLVGWWVAILSMSIAWLLSITIIGLPLALMMLNRIPEATTLRRN